jgi:CheY-like chemotaxis protein
MSTGWATQADHASRGSKRPSILLIDDDPTYSRLAVRRLELAGYQVAYHPGTFGVLDAVRRSAFDVILVDMMMPYIDGPRLLDLLRKRTISGARLVLVSSAEEAELQTAAVSHGAYRHFCKRWGLDRLAELVEAIASAKQR